MDNSILYGLRNPAMTDDIGMTMIERQYPTVLSPINHLTVDGKPIINSGQPESDLYQTKRQKEYSVIKKVLAVFGVIALGVFGYKKGVKGLTQAYNYVTSKSSSFFTGLKNGIKNVYAKIKTKISP